MFSTLNLANTWLIALILNTLLLLIALPLPRTLLTTAGLLHAWLLGVLVWGTLNWQGYVVVMFYFLVGSAVTKIGMAEKETAGIAEKRSGARGPENVWGSALTGTLCALAYGVIHNFSGPGANLEPIASLFTLGYVASFSTKLADTCASEIGKAYGKQTFLITTLKPVPRGTEGAISLEGTLAGIVGAIAIALVGITVGLINWTDLVFSVIAAFVATNIESLIGATWQTKYAWLTNEIVNGINTTIGAIVSMILSLIWQTYSRS